MILLRLKVNGLLHHTPLFLENFEGLCTTYKHTSELSPCVFGIPVMSVANPFKSRGRRRARTEECAQQKTHQKLWRAGIYALSQHSYYGFHVACKVLCIYFDQSLFGMPSHIKMLGIQLHRTNKPSWVLFQKHDFAVKVGGFDCKYSDDHF